MHAEASEGSVLILQITLKCVKNKVIARWIVPEHTVQKFWTQSQLHKKYLKGTPWQSSG